MSYIAPDAGQVNSRALEGILCIAFGMLLFVGQDGMMKFMLGAYPLWMLIFVRAVLAALILIPIIVWAGAPHRLITPLWPLHLARAGLFAGGFSLFYTAFPFMSLANVATIFFSAPLITAVFAAWFLRERIGPHRIAALLVGFSGVVITMKPSGDAFQWIAIFPLICAASYAASQIIARKIGDRETTITTGLYTIGLSGLLIIPMGWSVNQVLPIGPEFQHLRWEWPAVSLFEAARLALLGVLGMVGYMLLSRAYQVASASMVAPFEYTYLPIATVMGIFLWGETPASSTLLGMGLIVASGLYIGFREVSHARRSATPAPTATATFVPGNPTPPVPPDQTDH